MVWSFHRQTNKLNDYLNLLNLIFEFVHGFCGHTQKEEEKKTYGPVSRVAAQLTSLRKMIRC